MLHRRASLGFYQTGSMRTPPEADPATLGSSAHHLCYGALPRHDQERYPMFDHQHEHDDGRRRKTRVAALALRRRLLRAACEALRRSPGTVG